MDGDAADAAAGPATDDDGGDDGVAVFGFGDGDVVGDDGTTGIRQDPRTLPTRHLRHRTDRRSDAGGHPDHPPTRRLHHPLGPARPSTWFPDFAPVTYFSDS